MSNPCSNSDEEILRLEQGVGSFPQTLKRVVHNVVERKRKDKINGWIVKIGEILPDKDPKKQSKNKILERAVEFISYLKDINSQLLKDQCNEAQSKEVQRLEKQVKDLEEQNKSYLKLLKTAGISPMIPIEEELWTPKQGNFPKTLTLEQAEALKSRLIHNGFLTKDNGYDNNISVDSQTPVTCSSATLKNIPAISRTNGVVNNSAKVDSTAVTISSNKNGPSLADRSINTVNGVSTSEPQKTLSATSVTKSQMVITQALPTEPLMSTSHSGNVGKMCTGAESMTLTEMLHPSTANMSEDFSGLVSAQQNPLIVINGQSIPVVQNMLTFPGKPMVLGSSQGMPVLSPQFGDCSPTIELIGNGRTVSRFRNSLAVTVNQSNSGVMLSSNQIATQKIVTANTLSNSLVIRPQESLTTELLGQSFCSQRDLTSAVVCAQTNNMPQSLIPTHNGTIPNQGLPMVGQTMSFNPQGQVITLAPGTLLATPPTPGVVPTQQSWPSALLLPNGQIIPVVSQPSLMYTAHPSTVNGGLVIASAGQNATGLSMQGYQPNDTIVTASIPVATQQNYITCTNTATVNTCKTVRCFNQQSKPAVQTNALNCGSQVAANNLPKAGGSKKSTPQQSSKKAATVSKLNKAQNQKKPMTLKHPLPEKINATGNSKKAKPDKLIRPNSTPLPALTNAKSPAMSLPSTPPASFTLTFDTPNICENNITSNKNSSSQPPCSNELNANKANTIDKDILAKATESIFSTSLTDFTETIPEYRSAECVSAQLKSKDSLIETASDNSKNGPVLSVSLPSDIASVKNSSVTVVSSDRTPNAPVTSDKTRTRSLDIDNTHPGKKPRLSQTASSEKSGFGQADNTLSHSLQQKHFNLPLTNSETRSQAKLTLGNEFSNVSSICVSSQNECFSQNVSSATMSSISNRPGKDGLLPCTGPNFVVNNTSVIDSCDVNAENPDHELPALILGSLGDDSDAPSSVNSNSNSGLQFLALSPEHFSNSLGTKENEATQNAFTIINSNQINSVSFCNSSLNGTVSNQFIDQTNYQRVSQPGNSTLSPPVNCLPHSRPFKNSGTLPVGQRTSHISSENASVNPNPVNISRPQTCKQSQTLNHLSVTTSFLNNNNTTTTAVANSFHERTAVTMSVPSCISNNPPPNIVSRENLFPMPIHQLDKASRPSLEPPIISSIPSINMSNAYSQPSLPVPTSITPSIGLPDISVTSCYTIPSHKGNQSHMAGMIPNLHFQKPWPQPVSTVSQAMNKATPHSIETPTSNPILSMSSHNSRPSCGSSSYNPIPTRVESKLSNSAQLGNSHILSNYSAEALIGHSSTPHVSSSVPPSNFFNPSQAACSQPMSFSQSQSYCRPTSTSANRPLLSYSAESLLQNQNYIEKKKESLNQSLNSAKFYNQHLYPLPPAMVASTSHNDTLSQPIITSSSLATPLISSSASATINNQLGHQNPARSFPTSCTSYSSGVPETNFVGNHFTAGSSFLMRRLPHIPDTSHSLHPASQGSFVTAQNNCGSNAVNNPKHVPNFMNHDLSLQNEQNQGSGCLFPPHTRGSVHSNPLLPITEATFPLLPGPPTQSFNCSAKNSNPTNSSPMLNHFPHTPSQNHLVNNFFSGHFVPNIPGPNSRTESQVRNDLGSSNTNHYVDSSRKDTRGHSSNSRSPIPNKASPAKSNKSTSKKRSIPPDLTPAPTTSTITSSYDKTRPVPYFSMPELPSHDLQSCSVNRFFPDSHRHGMPIPPPPPPPNLVHHHHQQQPRLNAPLVPPPPPVPPIVGPETSIASDSSYNPLFRTQPQSGLTLNFQTPSFPLNSIPRIPITSSMGLDSAGTNGQLGVTVAANASSHHVPNFNLSNIFPDISTPSDSLSLNPIKFHGADTILTHPSAHIPTQPMGQDRIDSRHLTNGTTLPTGSLSSNTSQPQHYHNRSSHRTAPPHGMHNSLNGILGPGNHGFDGRGSNQVVMGIGNNTAPPPPPHFGHTQPHGAPFGNVLSTLTFPLHDSH